MTENAELRDRPTGELFKELSDQTTVLVRQEIELARAELGEKGKTAGLGAGLFGGAGVFGLGAFRGAHRVRHRRARRGPAAVAGRADPGGRLRDGGGSAALRGRDKVREAGPPVPEQATESVKEDVQWAKTRARSGRT
jgi:hypothetical protein